MAPVENRLIEFPIRKPRTRSAKAKLIEVEDKPKAQKPITRSPLKQVKSPKPSPLKSALSSLPSQNRTNTPHRVRLHFNENEENANPNNQDEIVTQVSPKKLGKVKENESPKLKSPSSKSTPVTPLSKLSLLQSPVKTNHRSPRKELFTPTSDRVLRTPTKKPLSVTSDNEDDGENKTPNKQNVDRSPRKIVKLAEGSLFRADVSHLVEAKKALSTALPPEEAGLVGRQKQLDMLKEFLRRNLVSNEGKKSKGKRSMYISGPPGTGKTTCLKHLIKTVTTDSNVITNGKDNITKEPDCIFINCMALKNGNAIYEKIAKSLSSATTNNGGDPIDSSKKALEEVIAAKESNRKILLVLDEIDQLDSKCNEVLYSLFEWPYLRNSKLILVGIANSLDLTDRILPRLKLRENICPEHLTFAAYSKKEISNIITSRLQSVSMSSEDVIKPAAISFLSAKISALSGDVRKALDVCRRAIELAETESRKQTLLSRPVLKSPGLNSTPTRANFKPIDIPQIMKILNEVYCTSAATASLNQANSDLPLQQKILIASLLLMTNYGKRPIKEVTASKLHETYTKLCKKRGMSAVNLSETLSLCNLLDARGIFSIRNVPGKKLSNSDIKVSLRIDEDEVQAALKDKTLLSGIIKDTECICK